MTHDPSPRYPSPHCPSPHSPLPIPPLPITHHPSPITHYPSPITHDPLPILPPSHFPACPHPPLSQGHWVSVRSPKSTALHNHIVAGEMIVFRNRMSRFDMLVLHGAVDSPVVAQAGEGGGGPASGGLRLSTPHLGLGDCVWLQVQLCHTSSRYAVRALWNPPPLPTSKPSTPPPPFTHLTYSLLAPLFSPP
jgi:hypothetical protein